MNSQLVRESADRLLYGMADFFHRPRVQSGLMFLGLAWSTKWILGKTLTLGDGLRIYILPRLFPSTVSKYWVTEFGPWAVVTGSTDGIGREFARQLASQGMNIVLISRNLEKLQKTAEEITRDFLVQTKVICLNFSVATPSTYKKVQEELESFDIGLLVNNVGVFLGVDSPAPFDEMSLDVLWDHAVVNAGAPTMMTRIILPQLKKRGKQGGIINISSDAALFPIPLIGSYSPSKMFIDYLSEVLRQENQDRGVKVFNLNPSDIATKMLTFEGQVVPPSLFVPTPHDYVKSALRALGQTETCAGYLPHAFKNGILLSLPYSWISKAMMYNIDSTIQTKVKKA